MRWSRTVATAVTLALLPLLAPAAWLHGGAFPDLALLLVVFVAFAAGPEPATRVGIVIGLAATPWTIEPLGQAAFLLGATGFVIGSLRRTLELDRASVRVATVAVTALVLRSAGTLLAGGSLLADARPILLAVAATAISAPPVMAALAGLRLVRGPARWRPAGV